MGCGTAWGAWRPGDAGFVPTGAERRQECISSNPVTCIWRKGKMFNSETYGKLNIEQIPEKLLAFYEMNKSAEGVFQIVVGTDSQNFNDTKMVTVIAAYKEGRGGIFFYEIDRINRITNVMQKLNTETSRSLEVMMQLAGELEEESRYKKMRESTLLSIHVDAGWSDKGKTKELIPGLIGWIRACGFEAKCKPESFAASSIADKISK